MEKKSTDMKILVADDMPNMRRTIKGMLRTMGYMNVLEASDGEDALKKLKSQRIEFLVTDWNMPKMTGQDLLKKIREDDELKTMPVLMITAEITSEQVARAAETMVNGYIIKPFVLKTFQAKMEEILDKKTKPSLIDVQLNIGKAMLDGGLLDKAISEYQKGLAKFPNSARLIVAMAEAHEKKKDTAKAEALYKRATEVNAMFTKAWEGLARMLSLKGSEGEALKALREAVKISPNNPQRQKDIGKLYLKSGNKEEAKKAFSQAIENSGDDSSISSDVGEALMEAGLEDEAADAFKKSLSVNPENLHIYNRLGIALRKKGRFGEAIEEYKRALEIAPDDEVLYFNMAKAYIESKKLGEALRAVEKSLSLDPDFQEAKDLRDQIKNKVNSL